MPTFKFSCRITAPLHERGFTLVELAIALMVIGLLIGGVLKGQELVNNARIVQTIRQLKAYDAAIMIFSNTYDARPGDIKNPATRLPNCTTTPCSAPGNGNKLYATLILKTAKAIPTPANCALSGSIWSRPA